LTEDQLEQEALGWARTRAAIVCKTQLHARRHAKMPRFRVADSCTPSSHQGSRANVTQELMRAVQAEHYVFSTNGA
jgi:hypothetical protein